MGTTVVSNLKYFSLEENFTLHATNYLMFL